MAGISQSNKFARVAGSGFTWFNFRGTVVGFAQAIGLESPRPVADPVDVHPLNYRRPAEVVVPRAITSGTLTVTMIDLWNEPVWKRLLGLEDTADLADVFEMMWRLSDDLRAYIVVDPPAKRGSAKIYREFHGIKVSDIRDDEQIDITTMVLNKPVTFKYAWSQFSNLPQKFKSEIAMR